MRITFVHIGREHLGIEYLSSMLKQAGHQTFLAYDYGLFSNEDNVLNISFLEKIFSMKKKVINKINETQPDLVAFTAYTSTYPWACEMAKQIKKENRIKIVFGGIHAACLC